jgi:hypothetical protein
MRVGDAASARDGRIAVDAHPAIEKRRKEPAGGPAPKPEERPDAEAMSPFARILHGLGREVDRGERLVRRATASGGQDLGPSELLALQAGVYRYSEAVDLSAKLVDRATNGVKTVLQGQ